MFYLSKKVLISTNRRVTQLNGDPFGVQNESNLDHLIAAVEYKYDKKPLQEALILKAAFMLDFIANKGHIFIEGNKRTAISSTLLFLALNEVVLEDLNEKELETFVLSVASGKQSLSSVASWLRQRIKAVERI